MNEKRDDFTHQSTRKRVVQKMAENPNFKSDFNTVKGVQ